MEDKKSMEELKEELTKLEEEIEATVIPEEKQKLESEKFEIEGMIEKLEKDIQKEKVKNKDKKEQKVETEIIEEIKEEEQSIEKTPEIEEEPVEDKEEPAEDKEEPAEDKEEPAEEEIQEYRVLKTFKNLEKDEFEEEGTIIRLTEKRANEIIKKLPGYIEKI